MSEKWKGMIRVVRAKPLVFLAGALGVLLLVGGALLGSGGKNGTASVKEEPSEAEITEEYRLALEAEVKALCERVKGVGDAQVSVMLESGTRYEYVSGKLAASVPPRVLGVAVVCEGGGSDTVKKELTDLISALFHIGEHRVHISKMK